MQCKATRILFPLLLIFSACQTRQESGKKNEIASDSLHLEYAKGFSAYRDKGIWHLTINTPYQGAMTDLEYLLVPRNQTLPPGSENKHIIRIPVKRIICTSTTHIPLLDYLGETNALVGFPTPDYISSPKMRKRIDEGKVENVGVDNAMSLENVLDLEPDMVMSYAISNDLGQMHTLEDAGMPVLINSEYLETHPLGRAEWIKLAGLLFDKSHEADSVFHSITKEYNRYLDIANKQSNRPSVMSGVLYSDTWYLPGGKNYAGTMLRDAGLDYIWSDNSNAGFLELSFESVLDKAQKADYWIGVASFHTLGEMEKAEPRYVQFRSFQNKQVYTYDARRGAMGGSEYLELGYLRPDLILADLIAIGHPDALPDHSLYFYARLK